MVAPGSAAPVLTVGAGTGVGLVLITGAGISAGEAGVEGVVFKSVVVSIVYAPKK
jgi:hypothetical protein